ncbi:GNAT family N-acetyltransferase [Arcanobacterium pinnipediorum]|uniref:GNAT family N-acetyltransferase n=1 Tax=Arcanobacterium pinnipediorum TaxID=1503041 RepID=A0ABY5AK52_9ACTO|nr:GNAT family N-acetyltransferase [Arcanobacterium pinnipediorum]USR79816.1 GNAT family N-acetyltransferase [Arcanobacterium pinnipediorum]
MSTRFPTREEFACIVETILIPSFPAAERPEKTGFMEMFDAGEIYALATFDQQTPTGISISFLPCAGNGSIDHADTMAGRSHSNCTVILLSWLAVGEAGRGKGVGSRLLDETVEILTKEHDPFLILIEVEDPHVHTEVTAYGDPLARMKFYERAGARRINLPFAMPREDITADVLPGMLLYSIGGYAHHAPPESDLPLGRCLTRFLRAYAQRAGEPQHSDGSFVHPDIDRMIRHAPMATFADR